MTSQRRLPCHNPGVCFAVIPSLCFDFSDPTVQVALIGLVGLLIVALIGVGGVALGARIGANASGEAPYALPSC